MRRALFSIMLIGIVAVGATVGGLAAFHDTESSKGNTFQAGDLDLKIDWETSYNGSEPVITSWNDLDASGDGPIFNFTDVKPGDWGETTISVHVFTNDAWVCGEIVPYSYDDVSSNEPELLVDDNNIENDQWDGELAQNLDITIWLENDGNNEYNDDTDRQLFSGKFSELDIPFYFNMDQNLNPDDGIQPLIGCENYYVGVSWSIDSSVGNEIQSDEIMFDIIFDAYQYRHQEDNNPCVPCVDIEELYLSDSGYPNNDGGGTELYSVTLDDTDNKAYLTWLGHLPATNFDVVAALACSKDFEELYAIDMVSKHLGIFNLGTSTFADMGVISGLPDGVVLASFSPFDDNLYIASMSTDELFTLNVDSLALNNLGTITKEGTAESLNIWGADIVFGADGTLYIWINEAPTTPSELGVWAVDISTMTAEHRGTPENALEFSGLAIRAGGTGDLVGSVKGWYLDDPVPERSAIWTVDPTDSTIGKKYPTYLDNDERHTLGNGDMAVGTICR